MNSFALTPGLRTAFRKIGAEVRAIAPPAPRRDGRVMAETSHRIRVRDETFELVLPAGAQAGVLDCRRAERHLVLNLREAGGAALNFLCGFDERHWFAAGVQATSVPAAKESLIPAAVRAAIERSGLRHRHRYHRRTPAFLRQGEWFFVPTDADVNRLLIHRNEPLIRPGGGKPHIVDEIVRGGGEMAWLHAQHAPNGLSEPEFRALPEPTRKAPAWQRRMRFRDRGFILARGAVRHSDHATIFLRNWHRVHINNEQRPSSLGFFD